MSLQRFDPTALIASMPASLRYDPERQILLVLLNTGGDDKASGRSAVASIAFTDPVGPAVTRVCAAARQIGATRTLAIVVDDRMEDSPRASLEAGVDVLLAALMEGLSHIAATLTHVWMTKRIAAGSTWWSLTDATDCGVLIDPGHTTAATDRQAKGYTTYPSRQALIDAVSPDRQLCAEVEQWMPTARMRVERARDRAAAEDCWRNHYRRGLLRTLFCIADVAAGEALPPKDLAELAMVLSDQMVLDCLHATASSEYQVHAEQLWTLLLRALAGPERAAPAALLAYSAYLRGDGVVARICVRAALQANTRHFTSRLLLAALDQAVPIAKLPAWTRFGVAAAADLGIDLAPADR
ncbi:DUF4192 domain-containing protein [Nocardia suismassiliense]|uniref:DUF4192 domain-containing protein n=1 Tax=Nocardia suismassiliense TaxID=2077092 RepID=A0ABW6R5V5_9NOCA